jgi:hypothetical protein
MLGTDNEPFDQIYSDLVGEFSNSLIKLKYLDILNEFQQADKYKLEIFLQKCNDKADLLLYTVYCFSHYDQLNAFIHKNIREMNSPYLMQEEVFKSQDSIEILCYLHSMHYVNVVSSSHIPSEGYYVDDFNTKSNKEITKVFIESLFDIFSGNDDGAIYVYNTAKEYIKTYIVPKVIKQQINSINVAEKQLEKLEKNFRSVEMKVKGIYSSIISPVSLIITIAPFFLINMQIISKSPIDIQSILTVNGCYFLMISVILFFVDIVVNDKRRWSFVGLSILGVLLIATSIVLTKYAVI